MAKRSPRVASAPTLTDAATSTLMAEVPADAYLSLRALSSYAGLSVRWLRRSLTDVPSPLPHYRVGGKLLVRRSEFDAWMTQFRHPGFPEGPRVEDRAGMSTAPRTRLPHAPRSLDQLSDRQVHQLYKRAFPNGSPTDS
jgi:hypothetical protein